jgi:hypothetical protein
MKAKKFDSVKMMRDIRDNVSKEFSKLSAMEKINLLEKKFPEIKIGKRRKLPITTDWR